MRCLAFVALVGFPLVATADPQLPEWAAPMPHEAPVSAEPPAMAGSTDPGLPATPAPVPLDGGLGLLALAGGAYAARRLRRAV